MFLRTLRRDPILATAATATLALCISANSTMFSLVNSILLRPLPYPGGDRICWLDEHIGGRERMAIAFGADYYSLREKGRIFEDVAALDTLTVNWTGIERPEQLDAAQVTPSFFRVMGDQPLSGRYLAGAEMGTAAPRVAVLSYALSRRASGGAILLDRQRYTVIGVMPQGFDYPQGTQVWIPMPMDEQRQRPRSAQSPMRIVNLLARIRPKVTDRARDAEMRRLTQTVRAEYPREFETAGYLDNLSIAAVPLRARMTGDLRPALLVLTGAVGLVLLIACVNLANLLLARAAGRRQEFAIRFALGASRLRIVRQVLGESLALAVPGGLAGAALAAFAVALLNAAKPAVLLRYPAVSLDTRTLGFTFGLTLLTGLLFGAAPAFRASSPAPGRAPRTAGLRRSLMIAELAISLVLLIGAGLFTRSFLKLAHVELGFPADHLLTLRVNLTGSRYATAESQMHFYDDVLGRIGRLPGVRSAAVSQDIPLSGQVPWDTMVYHVPGHPAVPVAQRPSAQVTVVSRGYFETLGIPLRAGDLFTALQDSIVVNEAFARRAFPGEDPVGRDVVFGPRENVRWKIAGVVGNVRGAVLGAEPEAMFVLG